MSLSTLASNGQKYYLDIADVSSYLTGSRWSVQWEAADETAQLAALYEVSSDVDSLDFPRSQLFPWQSLSLPRSNYPFYSISVLTQETATISGESYTVITAAVSLEPYKLIHGSLILAESYDPNEGKGGKIASASYASGITTITLTEELSFSMVGQQVYLILALPENIYRAISIQAAYRIKFTMNDQADKAMKGYTSLTGAAGTGGTIVDVGAKALWCIEAYKLIQPFVNKGSITLARG